MDEPRLRPLFWVGGSKKEYRSFPLDLRHDIGYLLYRVQEEQPVPDEKPLNRGPLQGLGIREIAVDWEDGTYRVVYTVKLRAGVYVLHAFKKKSKHGIATPQHDIELIRARFAMAMRIDDASSPL
ncbi:MAG TPA: type II toxin-antitoxin system RelE/ParE family toxin [Longimicrobium sp.]|nr:type II toxin-antitoxin system RelE/ParE family toxin [Longimicrobium sp.]